MKKLSLYIFLLMLFVQNTITVCAQTASEDLNKISALFASAKTFKTDFEFQLTNIEKPNKVLEKSKGAMFMSGKDVYMNSLGTETIINDSFNVVIYHREKVMIVGRNSSKSFSQQDVLTSLFNKNKLLENSGNLTLTKISSSLKKITVKYDIGEYSSIDIVYNTKNYFVQEITMIYRAYESGTPCVKIKYTNSKTNVPISTELFNEKRVLTIRNKKVYPASYLKGYQIIQNL